MEPMTNANTTTTPKIDQHIAQLEAAGFDVTVRVEESIPGSSLRFVVVNFKADTGGNHLNDQSGMVQWIWKSTGHTKFLGGCRSALFSEFRSIKTYADLRLAIALAPSNPAYA